ncbi:hypothetical protein KEM55_000842, partial [Ascosphaera atra]
MSNDVDVVSVMPDGDVPVKGEPIDKDAAVMEALGYKQEFKREFSLWSSFASFYALALTARSAKLMVDDSGGLYYAAAVLAPDGWGPLAAWITGWSNWLTQITAGPSCDYGMAGMVLAGVSITHPDYEPKDWHTYVLTAAIIIIHSGISSMPTKWIATFNNWGSGFN